MERPWETVTLDDFQIGDRVRINQHGWARIVEMNPISDDEVLTADVTEAVCTVVRLWPEYGLLSVKHPWDFTVLMAPESLERAENT